MKLKLKFKNILMVSTLAIAGLLGASSFITLNVSKESMSVKEAKAVKPDTIYFTLTTAWGGGNSAVNVGNVYVYYYGSCDAGGSNPQWGWPGKKITEISGARILENSYSHLNIAAIPNTYHHANVIFSVDTIGNDSKQTVDLTIPTDGNNFFMILSNQDSGYKQYGDWLEFDEANQRINQNNVDWSQSTLHHKTDTLYFVPSQEWCTNRGDNGKRIWPRLNLTFPSISVGGVNYTSIQMYPTGITEPDPNWVENGDKRIYVFYYDNIPLTTLNSAYFEASASGGKVLRLNSTQRTYWYNGSSVHSANAFGSESYNWAGTGWDYTVSDGNKYSGYYYTPNRDSKTFIIGDVLLNESINWSDDEWPEEYNSLDKEDGGNYSKTLRITKGDMFKYVTYRCFANVSAVSKGSSWNLYDKRGPHGYWLDNVTIYDKNGQIVTNKNEYIFNDGSAFRFLKSGIVKFRRLSSKDYTLADLELWFSEDTETNSNYYLVGEGSFVNGTPTWDISTGVRMKDDSNNHAFLRNQLLKQGDIFAVKDTSGNSYAWDSTNNNGVYNSNFSFLVRNNMMWTVKDGSWWSIVTEKGTYDIEEKEVPAEYCPVYLKIDCDSWPADYAKFGVKCNATNTVYVGIKVSDDKEYGQRGVTVKCIIPAKAFTDGIVICRMNSSCSEGAEYTYNTNVWNETNSNCPTNASGMVDTFKANFNKVYVLNTGYYNIRLNTSNKIKISSIDDFLPDDGIYFDLGSNTTVVNNWKSKHIGVRFWNSADTARGSGTNVEMYLVHDGHDLGESRYLFEANIPVLPNGRIPNMVLFYADTSVISQDDFDWTYATQDQGRITGLNVCRLTGDVSDSKYTCTWPDNITNEDRADIYADYFNSEVICDNGVHPPKRWDVLVEPATSNVNTEFQHICINAQGVIWLANEDENGTNIERAMSKYDYIVRHYRQTGQYPDFIQRSNPGSGSVSLQGLNSVIDNFNPFGFGMESITTIIIIVTSSLSLLSITTLSILLIKKRKKTTISK